jgi:hypothetical protein
MDLVPFGMVTRCGIWMNEDRTLAGRATQGIDRDQ